MIRTVGILVFEDVEVLDFAGPFEVFSVASQLNDHMLFDVKLIAKKKNPVIAVNGLSVNPDFSFENAPKLDILIIAGGSGSMALLNDAETLDFVDHAISTAELSMSICSGSRILAKLGYLDHKPYCTHHQVYDHMSELVPSGKPQKGQRFVRSAPGLYTSGGISAGIDLSFYVVTKLHGRKVALNTAEYMEYHSEAHHEDIRR
ncbi:MAG: DJ-1/PfpI family protein [Bacteroidota bacterium]